MGAPMGNRNAAGSRGGYKSSGAKKYLRSKMSSYTRKQMSWYQGSTPAKQRSAHHEKVKAPKMKMKFT